MQILAGPGPSSLRGQASAISTFLAEAQNVLLVALTLCGSQKGVGISLRVQSTEPRLSGLCPAEPSPAVESKDCCSTCFARLPKPTDKGVRGFWLTCMAARCPEHRHCEERSTTGEKPRSHVLTGYHHRLEDDGRTRRQDSRFFPQIISLGVPPKKKVGRGAGYLAPFIAACLAPFMRGL